ncbi:DeoR/GlpR family DNA-binding transcription regulator [Alicyclobacillus acidoterrestris]|uniref:DeoR/GlpR family DNA-binding transcription regulator n=1 Tax=Alicyclobacillus acidoterrestris TaxID=1450 RepID=UPI003F52E7D6
MNNLFQEERLEKIMNHMMEHRRISVQEICDLFGVSRDTARRDVVKLTERGMVVRTQGGAILPSIPHYGGSYFERVNLDSTVKSEIGRVAATLVDDEDFIILDTSTTVLYLTDYIHASNVTIVTNGIDIAACLADKDNCTIHLLPGKLNKLHRFVYGSSTVKSLSEYQVNKVFLGGGSITEEGIFTSDEEEAALKRQMIQQADEVILLADHLNLEDGCSQKWLDSNISM